VIRGADWEGEGRWQHRGALPQLLPIAWFHNYRCLVTRWMIPPGSPRREENRVREESLSATNRASLGAATGVHLARRHAPLETLYFGGSRRGLSLRRCTSDISST
jgi:hypothetical protein